MKRRHGVAILETMQLHLALTLIVASLAITGFADEPRILFRSGMTPEANTEKQANYTKSLQQLLADRNELRNRFAEANGRQRESAIADARARVIKALLNDIFPAWHGTTWDFNGVSQTPGEGQIACGYFVTTCLRDAGFNLERVKLAQQASQRIIKTLADPDDMKLIYDKPMPVVEKHLLESGPGIYIVGLDQHTGFVVNDGEDLAFIHSSYYRPPFSVTAEPIDGQNPLADSRYRIFGKILSDEMMRKWILGEKFEMK